MHNSKFRVKLKESRTDTLMLSFKAVPYLSLMGLQAHR